MLNRLLVLALIVILMTLTTSCQLTKGEEKMEQEAIFGKGDKAPSQIFSNTVWVKMLLTDEDKVFDTQAYNVTFEPSGRTYWHSHPGGQVLFATDGVGYYQEKDKPAQKLLPGDVVPIPPNVVHWHGAAPDSQFVHLGMSAQVHLGPADWFGEVTDEQYKEATSK